MAAPTPDSEELVLAFLAEAGDEFVSGEVISDKLGLSRAAVWKHVDALRAQGYTFVTVPELLAPATAEPGMVYRP